MIYDERRDDGSHVYWQQGLGGLVELPEKVAAAHIHGNDLLILIDSFDLVALAEAFAKQASVWLDSKVEPVPPAPFDPAEALKSADDAAFLLEVERRMVKE